MKHIILVVEDNPLNRELLCDWLEVEGYEVLSVEDLNAAMDSIEDRQPNAYYQCRPDGRSEQVREAILFSRMRQALLDIQQLPGDIGRSPNACKSRAGALAASAA